MNASLAPPLRERRYRFFVLRASRRSWPVAEYGRGDLLGYHFNGITRRIEASEVRQDAAVLGYLIESDVVEHGNQRLLSEQSA